MPVSFSFFFLLAFLSFCLFGPSLGGGGFSPAEPPRQPSPARPSRDGPRKQLRHGWRRRCCGDVWCLARARPLLVVAALWLLLWLLLLFLVDVAIDVVAYCFSSVTHRHPHTSLGLDIDIFLFPCLSPLSLSCRVLRLASFLKIVFTVVSPRCVSAASQGFGRGDVQALYAALYTGPPQVSRRFFV